MNPITDRYQPAGTAQPLTQKKTIEWHSQWLRFGNDADFQFHEWIAPATLETFRGRDVLECGCGGGDHTFMVADLARKAYCVIQTGERRFYGCFFFKKGVIAPDAG